MNYSCPYSLRYPPTRLYEQCQGGQFERVVILCPILCVCVSYFCLVTLPLCLNGVVFLVRYRIVGLTIGREITQYIKKYKTFAFMLISGYSSF